MQQWFGLFGPAGLPAPIVAKLNPNSSRRCGATRSRTRCCRRWFRYPRHPEELGAIVARDLVRLGQVVRESGAKAPD